MDSLLDNSLCGTLQTAVANPAACPALRRSGRNKASPAAVPPPMAPLGLALPESAIS